MTAEQFICCDTYKGKMTIADFIENYGLPLAMQFGVK
jgi:hypothetical protein